MGGQAAEQIIAGVVLSERLAVTMYGAIHRAQFGGQRNLRGLVVDPKMLAEDAFRLPLTDARAIGIVTRIEHPSIVPTVTVESGGPDVVVVTRGSGRYVTVQDLITAAKSRGSKLPLPVAALIGKSVIEALAVAHKAGVIHGAVHPRSVLVDVDGSVKLDDFVVGRALTTAVAQGADSSLWRGLNGYIAPELVIGEDPQPGADVFAVGAMLFTMLSGEAPPGNLRVTPAVERLVQRALDTDPQRRYKTASDLLDNLLEAIEDDRWEIAERGELIKEAGLQATDTNIDDATEDLLASLGEASVIVTASRASQDIPRAKSPGNARLDSLIADMRGDTTGLTQVDDKPFRKDPISELIRQEPRKKEAIVSSARVPSLDDPDDETPLPPPTRESDMDIARDEATRRAGPSGGKRNSSGPPSGPRSATADEAAALAALGGLDEGAKRVTTAAEQASAAAHKLEQAAARAEAAAKRVETPASVRRIAPPVVDAPMIEDLPTPRLKSRMVGVVSLLVIAGVIAFGYWAYQNQEKKAAEAAKQKKDDDRRKEEEAAQKLREAPDYGDIVIDSNPNEAGVWLHLGKAPLDTARFDAQNSHELMLIKDGFEATEAQVGGVNWSGNKDQKTLAAKISVTLKPARGKKPPALPLQPNAQHITSGIAGDGPIHVESDPPGAEVYLFMSITGSMHWKNTVAGRDYEFAVIKDGFKPATVSIKADDWRDNDPTTAIDSAKKKSVLERTVELEPVKGK